MAQLIDIKLTDLQRDPMQPRKEFNQEALDELAESIRANGVIQAITARPTPPDNDGPPYMIIAGERRWRASSIAEKETIPCIIKETSEADINNIRSEQLTENLFREDLNPVEKAEFIQSRIDELKEAGITDAVSQVAKELGVSNSWVSKNTAILKVSEDVRALARIGKIKDYSIVKKVDKLKGNKRDQAIKEINDGSFIAKEFFKRKRYDIPQEQASNNDTDNTARERRIRTVSFKVHEIIPLIDKTDYRYVLDKNDPDWRNNNELLPRYLTAFKEWAMQPSMEHEELEASSA